METIAVVEDDSSLNFLYSGVLRYAGYTVVSATDGQDALEQMASRRPGLILCDVVMPRMDGLELLLKLRANPEFWRIPFIFLTGLMDKATRRRAMTLGADDFMTKPLDPGELLAAVAAQLTKFRAREQALAGHGAAAAPALVPAPGCTVAKAVTGTAARTQAGAITDSAARTDAAASAVSSNALRASADAAALNATGRIEQVSVLFADIRNFTTISEHLMAGETAQLLNAYLERACKPVLGAGGRVVKFIGDAMMAVFEAEAGEPPHLHALRALAAGVALASTGHEFREWVEEHFPDRALPPFSIGVGIHSGDVMFCRIGGVGAQEETVIGDPVNIAARLEEQSKQLGWAVVASAATITLAGADIGVGGRHTLTIRGRSEPVEAAEVLHVSCAALDTSGAWHPERALSTLPQGLRTALSANARQAARAAKEALSAALLALAPARQGSSAATTPALPPMSGYHSLSRLGAGSVADVFLATRESDQRKVALKVFRTHKPVDPLLARRFVEEAVLLIEIEHPNVVRVHDYGVSDEAGFIEMEYISGGSLRERMAAPLAPRTALALLAQMVQALRAIHRMGIVHRDIKPANFMLRADGMVVLADFGIAKRLAVPGTRTVHGTTLGTPHYLSPEQAAGEEVTASTDLYSIGVILFEMLCGRHAYPGSTFTELLAQHSFAPVPVLPPQLAVFQTLLDRLMAKQAAARPADASAALELIDEAWTRAATAGWPDAQNVAQTDALTA